MPDFVLEKTYGDLVVGIDEAGRGPWAGPVVAGAVLFKNRDCNSELVALLDDSKKLSAKKREKIYEMLLKEAEKGNILCAIGEASVEKYPYYGFEKNAGYGTKLHIEGLKKYGVSPIHRRSYKPIKEFLENKFQ